MPSINVDRGPPFNKVTARHTCSPVFHIFVPDCAGEKKKTIFKLRQKIIVFKTVHSRSVIFSNLGPVKTWDFLHT